MQAVGNANGLKALDVSIDGAFRAAGVPRAKVAAVCMGLAGVDRTNGLDVIHDWATKVDLAASLQVANDATLLLAAGTPDGWGLAVIAGTGSIAFVERQDGHVGRGGGWGYLLGDEGSAYAIALSGLRAACRSYDGVGPKTLLVERFVKSMGLQDASDMILAVYQGPWDRTAIAGLAPVVMEAAAGGDAIAIGIVRHESGELAQTAAAAIISSSLPMSDLPVALAGGVLTKSEAYREEFLGALLALGVSVGPVQLVTDPVAGAIVLARKAAAMSHS